MVERERTYRHSIKVIAQDSVWFPDKESIVNKPDSLLGVDDNVIAFTRGIVSYQWNQLSALERQQPQDFLEKLDPIVLVTLLASGDPLVQEMPVVDRVWRDILTSAAEREIDESVQVLIRPESELNALWQETNLDMAKKGFSVRIDTLQDFKDSLSAPIKKLRALQQKLRGQRPLSRPTQSRI